MLKEKIVLITGATGGMGKVLCKELAAQGAKLALSSTRETELVTLCDELKRTYRADIIGAVVDVTQETQVEKFVNKVATEFGKIDAVINLAGVSIPGKIAETEEETYNLMMDVNVKSVYFVAKYFVKYAAKNARMINIGSMAARRTNGNAPFYCVAKSAVNTLSQGLAMQLSSQGIHVTTLNPGGTDTPFWGERQVPRENMLQPEDIVDVVLFVLNCNPRVAIHCVDFESIYMMK